MEEKILIKGTFSKINVFSVIFILIGVFGFCGGISSLSNNDEAGIAAAVIFMLIGFGGAIIFYHLLNKCEITVTDKKVYGKAAFGHRVDLPFDMISSVGTCALKGINVATSSGEIKFYFCTNKENVFSEISDILLERQGKKNERIMQTVEVKTDEADQLKKYKDLLDSGVITQEEFDAKKKQLLGL